jgi:hypothetical protein
MTQKTALAAEVEVEVEVSVAYQKASCVVSKRKRPLCMRFKPKAAYHHSQLWVDGGSS